MALTYRSCAICNTRFPVRPQAPHAKFCSTKCRVQSHRQDKQSATPTEATTITIEETPMSNTVPMQFTFSESEYQSRCENAKGFYLGRIESPATSYTGAIVEFAPQPIETAFEQYHQLRTEGYTTFDSMSPLPSINVVQSPIAGALVTLYMLKPQDQQEADLEIIFAQVRADYEAELERGLETELDRQVQLMLDQQDRAKEQAAVQERQQREQAARDELAAARAKLREELIQSNKLNSDGSAA